MKISNLFGAFSLDSGTYPAVKENHQKAKANEDNQCHKQETSHHGEVILSIKKNGKKHWLDDKNILILHIV